MFTKIQHHEQNQIVHPFDGNKNDRSLFLIPLTREQFNNFRQEDTKRLYNMSRPSQIEPHTPMTTFTGHTKSSATSE